MAAPKEPIERMEGMVRGVEALRDPEARAAAVGLAQAVLDFQAAVLARVVEIGSMDPDLLAAMVTDDLVSGALALHGLHPDDVGSRVRRTVDKLRYHFDSRGAGIELLSAGSDLVRLRFTGTRPGAGAAAKQLIEDAIYQAAPEIAELVIEGVEEQRKPGFVPLAELLATQPA